VVGPGRVSTVGRSGQCMISGLMTELAWKSSWILAPNIDMRRGGLVTMVGGFSRERWARGDVKEREPRRVLERRKARATVKRSHVGGNCLFLGGCRPINLQNVLAEKERG
jgi:hypothetical protein